MTDLMHIDRPAVAPEADGRLYWHSPDASLYLGDCLHVLPFIADASVDLVLSDPPYPEVDRSYGRWSVPEWEAMMHAVVRQCRRILKPHGSAVFILQPNSERVGKMRPWLWDFMGWCCREWNVVQDHYWWNHAAMPNSISIQGKLLRSSVKPCVWVGEPDCYRDQDSVLWTESEANVALRTSARCGRTVFPSGHSVNEVRISKSALLRGGTLPFNLLPIANTNSVSSAGAEGHGAGTPEALCDWWIRYLTRPGDLVADPFAGVATVGRAALRLKRRFLGIERIPEYVETAARLLDGPPTPLFDAMDSPRRVHQTSFIE